MQLFIDKYRHLLPEAGKALDVACGHGRHAIALARAGFSTDALDISDVGLEILRRKAMELKLEGRIRAIEVDLNEYKPEGAYDLIICTYYLNRQLIPRLKRALRPGGIIYSRAARSST